MKQIWSIIKVAAMVLASTIISYSIGVRMGEILEDGFTDLNDEE